MRDLYKYAQQVIVWLGEEENESGLAVKNIRLWSNTFDSSFMGEPTSLLGGKQDIVIKLDYKNSVSDVYTDFVSTFLRDKR